MLFVEALSEKLCSLKQGLEDVATQAFQLEEVVYQMKEIGGISHSEVPEKVKGRFQYTKENIYTRQIWDYDACNLDALRFSHTGVTTK